MPTKTTIARAAGLATVVALAPPASARDITIADLAPSTSMIVLGSDDMGVAKAAFDRTGFKNIWEDRELRDWVSSFLGDMMEQTREDLDGLGVDMDELLVAPAGATGMAMWTNEENEDQESAEFVIFADYQDNADGLNENIVEMIMAAVEKGAFTLDENDFGDATIYSLTRVEDEDDDADEGGDDGWEDEGEWGEDDGWEDDWDMGEFEEPASPIDMDELHYARIDGRLVVSSHLAQTERAIDLFETGADDEGIADNANFQGAMNAIGDRHAFFHLSLASDDFMDEIQNMPQLAMFGGMMQTLGLDSLKAATMGMRFDTDDAMMESRFAVDAPEKKGLLALLDNPPMKLSPPSFVQANTASFNAIQFDLANLLPTLEKAMNTLPPDQAGQMGMMFQQIQMVFGPLFSTLGPEIYMVSNIEKPYSATSNKTVTMIRAKDPQVVNQALQQFAPMMGLAPRDFLGHTVWSAAGGGMGMMGQMPAIGIGGGYLTMGDETTVENALRAIDRAGDGGLADEDAFKRAVAPLEGEALAYGYVDTAEAIAYSQWTMKNMRAIIEQQVANMPGIGELDPEFKDQMIQDQLDAIPEHMRNVPSMDAVTNNMGNTAFQVLSTDTGFTGRWIVHRAD